MRLCIANEVYTKATHTRALPDTHTDSCKRALAHTHGLAPLRLAPCRMQKGRTRYPRRHHPAGGTAAAGGRRQRFVAQTDYE